MSSEGEKKKAGGGEPKKEEEGAKLQEGGVVMGAVSALWHASKYLTIPILPDLFLDANILAILGCQSVCNHPFPMPHLAAQSGGVSLY